MIELEPDDPPQAAPAPALPAKAVKAVKVPQEPTPQEIAEAFPEEGAAPVPAHGRNGAGLHHFAADSAMPHSIEAEEHLLSCCLIDGPQVADTLARTLPQLERDKPEGVFFSNELVDAFPVRAVAFRKQEWHERYVTTAKDGFAWTEQPIETLDLIERRMKEIVENTAIAMGCEADFVFDRTYPPTINHPKETAFAANVMRSIVGAENVNDSVQPTMGAEDFAYMLEARPGAFIFMGNGDSAGLHHPAYNFNDDAIVYGSSYWVKLVETTLAA